MRKISTREAANKHNISSCHEEMDNGELRFRLRKNDGTAYIRTEKGDAGGWQESHYHDCVRETYIVQSGWIGYAEQLDGNNTITIYEAGQLFTTNPGIVHNVYMSSKAIIHTVKHGNCNAFDRKTDGTELFNAWCESHRDSSDVLTAGLRDNPKTNTGSTYTSEYRHFDNLIWQVPSWVTAIFALSIGALGSDSLSSISKLLGFEQNWLAVTFLIIVSVTLFCFSRVMYRFRHHQSKMKKYSPTPFWQSASFSTQLIINIQATALAAIAAFLAGIPMALVIIASILLLMAHTWNTETNLRHQRLK